MGTDRTKSLSEKEREQLLRLHFGRETGRPTVEEVEARQWLADFEEFQALKELGLLDSLRDQLSGDEGPQARAPERPGLDVSRLLGLLGGDKFDKKELLAALGDSTVSMAAPYAAPAALLMGWYLAEEYAKYTVIIYQKDKEGNYLKDAEGNKIPELDDEGNPVTKTIQPPKVLHNLTDIMGLTATVLEVLVHALAALIEKDPIDFLKKYQPGIDLSLLKGGVR